MRRYDEFVEVRSGRIGEGIAGLDAEQLAIWPEGPSQFVWRNRLWRVLGVQARWVESGPWWDSAAVRAARGDAVPGDAGVGPNGAQSGGVQFSSVQSSGQHVPAASAVAVSSVDAAPAGPRSGAGIAGGVPLGGQGAWTRLDADSGGAESVGADVGADLGDDADLLCEQEVWRVEAANGRDGGRGVYELAHSWANGSWRLRSVLD